MRRDELRGTSHGMDDQEFVSLLYTLFVSGQACAKHARVGGVLKVAEANKAMDNAKRVYEEYRPLKMEVDQLRTNVGLDRLPEMQHESENFAPE